MLLYVTLQQQFNTSPIGAFTSIGGNSPLLFYNIRPKMGGNTYISEYNSVIVGCHLEERG